MPEFMPTLEQTAIIECENSAFISACPGSGKTRCIVERARSIFSRPHAHRGLAFLSFTNNSMAEAGRELYVAASRAEKLLVFACPKSQSDRLVEHMRSHRAAVTVTEI